MTQGIYFCATALPSLDELGSVPAITPMGLLAMVDGYDAAIDRVSLMFLFDDLMQRQAFLAGELSAEQISPTVLTAAQVRNEEPLPGLLVEAQSASAGDSVSEVSRIDGTWDRYFRHAVFEAESLGSDFVRDWVGFEVALRNALTAERAKSLGVDVNLYLVSPDLAGAEDSVTMMVSEWQSAPTPLAGEQALLMGRWQWAQLNDRWFSFDADELAAYALKLMLLMQWQRIGKK